MTRPRPAAQAAIRAKVRGPTPPGSGYFMAGLLDRACCSVSCAIVRERVKFLAGRAATIWTSQQYAVIAAELEAAKFCGGKVQLDIPPQARSAPK